MLKTVKNLHVRWFKSKGNTQGDYSFKSHSKILGSTVQVAGSITEGFWLVVVQQTLLPDAPRLGISELGDGSIQESDGSAAVIVVRHPLHGLVDPVHLGVHQAPAHLVAGRVLGHLGLEHIPNSLPHVKHVELVHHSLQRAPVRAQAVVFLSHVAQDLVDRVHRVSGKVVAERVVWSEWDHLEG